MASSRQAETPLQSSGFLAAGVESLEGTDRNIYASRAWKGGNMKFSPSEAPLLRRCLFVLLSAPASVLVARHQVQLDSQKPGADGTGIGVGERCCAGLGG